MRVAESLPVQLVVAGTDTGIGKTLVASILVAGLAASYWKPIQSGLAEQTDSDTVRRLSGRDNQAILPEAYRLSQPLSPHAAAERDGVTIDPAKLQLPALQGRLIVEGAGGLMVPLNDRTLQIDVIKSWGLPVLLVAGTRLGTINHTLLSLSALRQYEIGIVGVVMSGEPDAISRQAIEHHGKTRVLAVVPRLAAVTPATIHDAFERNFGGNGH